MLIPGQPFVFPSTILAVFVRYQGPNRSLFEDLLGESFVAGFVEPRVEESHRGFALLHPLTVE